MSVAVLLLVAAAIVAGFHASRRPPARRPARATRPHAWVPTAGFLTATALLFALLFAAAFTAGS
ncbi:hypothetical protein OWR29_19490 [Actinoplanes sp. Pm04-4]|uniref:Uncharacterized protein n=1 Tax=Paractinoplanes pyxinae TaxID=2997416 RepID=A0ABT4B145_9ACTN|nr:hypothetical protein [Actinoplanes pyxinae]MCY1140189.1 hypothetical protein [Actinoplanes pyxinae]